MSIEVQNITINFDKGAVSSNEAQNTIELPQNNNPLPNTGNLYLNAGLDDLENDYMSSYLDYLSEDDNEYDVDALSSVPATVEGGKASQVQGETLKAQTDMFGALNSKYNLGLDLSKPLSDSDIKLIQQAYISDMLADTTVNANQSMNSYFNTLGKIDEVYDGIKDLFGSDLTRESIEEYYNQEVLRNTILTTAAENKGSVRLSDSNGRNGDISREDLASLVSTQIKNLKSFDDYVNYAVNMLGITEKDALVLASEDLKSTFQNYYNNPLESYEITKNDEGKYVVGGDESFIELVCPSAFADKLIEISDVRKANSLSFEQVFAMTTGVSYDLENIQNAMALGKDYANITEIQTMAMYQEQYLAQATPQQAFEYFQNLAEQSGGSVTGAELFNEYYKSMFSYTKEGWFGSTSAIASSKCYAGYSCVGISISEDGKYLYQEMDIPEDTVADLSFDRLYHDEETGKYYQLVDLENNNVITNYGEFSCDEYLGFPPLSYFERANSAISKNNLYFEQNKQAYDAINGENAFDTILEEYPKVHEEAFGSSILTEKLTDYVQDMDSYSKKLSSALSIGCFMASFIPGVNVAAGVIFGAVFLDNGIDLVNLATNKQGNEFGSWFLQTGSECLLMAVGMGINKGANYLGNKLTSNWVANGSQFAINHAAGVEAAIEYGFDNLASIAWDVGKGVIDGSMINEDGSFNWDNFRQVAIQNAIFNTADLRNGMALYKSLQAGNAVDIGNGLKFEIDSSNGAVKYVLQDGSEIKMNSNGTATLLSDGDEFELVRSKDSTWVMSDGSRDFSIDLRTGGLLGEVPKLSFEESFNNNIADGKLISSDYNQLKTILMAQDNPKLAMQKMVEWQSSGVKLDDVLKIMSDIDVAKLPSAFENALTLKPGLVKQYLENVRYTPTLDVDTIKVLTLNAAELEAEYIKNMGKVNNQVQALFDKSDEDIAAVTGRPKSLKSIYEKIAKKFIDGKIKSTDIDTCRSVVADAYGTRVQMKSLTADDVTDMLNIFGIDCSVKDFGRYLLNDTSGMSEALIDSLQTHGKEVLYALKEIQSQPTVDRIISQIETGQPFTITELNNYGGDISAYFTPRQVCQIADAYFAATGKKLTVVTQDTKISDFGMREMNQEGEYLVGEHLRIKTKGAEKDSGYTSAQMNTEHNIGNGNVALGELQIRGSAVNAFADVEHIPYDIRTGKIKPDDPKYQDIYGIIKSLDDTSYTKYNEYLTSVYNHYRLAELGIKTDMPKIGGGYIDKDGNMVDVSMLTQEMLTAVYSHK